MFDDEIYIGDKPEIMSPMLTLSATFSQQHSRVLIGLRFDISNLF